MKHTVFEASLASGSKGLFVHVPGATVFELEFTFLSGFDYAPADKYELPHSMEHLLMCANKKYTNKMWYARELEKNGAYTNAYTSQLLNGYVATTPAFEWKRVTELFWHGLTSPLFKQAEFDTEHETVREELFTKLENHSLMLHIAQRKALESGVSIPDYRERIELLPNVTQSDLVAYHNATHTAQNMRFIIAGDLGRGREASLTQLLEKYTNELNPGSRSAITQLQLRKNTPSVSLEKDIDKIYFDIKCALNRELSEREQTVISLIIIILTSSWDSRLFGTARNKGLVYYMGSNMAITSGTSVYTIFGTVVPEKAQQLFDHIRVELKKLQLAGISDTELNRAKKHMLGNFQISHQTPSALVNWYSRYCVYDDYYTFTDQAALIQSIEPADVSTLLNELLSKQTAWSSGVLGRDASSTAQQLHDGMAQVWD